MTQTKAILVVSDLHCGSIYGMLPPDFATQDGAPKVPNAGQKYLWECWLDLAKRVASLPILAVVVNGEIVKKEKWESFLPAEGDEVEIVSFVGGG